LGTPPGGVRPGEQLLTGTYKCGTARATHWHARPGEHCSSGMWGTARAALRGARPGEHCFSGTWGTARATQQSFSSVGKNAHKGAKLRGALAHWDVRLQEAWAPQRDAG
jgi:hypothetical protein